MEPPGISVMVVSVTWADYFMEMKFNSSRKYARKNESEQSCEWENNNEIH